MTRWLAFAGFVFLLTTAMVVLTVLTQRALEPYDATSDDATNVETTADDSAGAETTVDDSVPEGDDEIDSPSITELQSAERNSVPATAAGEAVDADDDLAVEDRQKPDDDRREPDDDRREPDEGGTVETAEDGPVETAEDGPAESAEDGPVEAFDDVRDPPHDSTGSADETHDPFGIHRDHAKPTGTLSSRPAGKRIVATVDGTPVTARGLVVNVTVTQALFLALLVGAILAANVPAEALGVEWSVDAIGPAVVGGVAIGLGFYVASEVVGALVVRAGFGHDEWLRESLAPATLHGWVVLLVVVLPLIAVFEELLFRAVLIGALATGFAISEWLLVVGSTVVFAVGHGIQGSAGIVVTGLIGFGLAVAFVLSGSLLLVVVAHYVLNCCEFVIHEGLDVQWQSAFAG